MQVHESASGLGMAKTAVKPVTKGPSEETTSAWARLVRVQQSLLGAVERDLKKARFPPLVWYDALLELSRHPNGHMRPVELEKQMLIPQYGMSRLIDRMAEAGFVQRMVCPVDGRGQYVGITASGRALQKKMWSVYAAAIEQHVSAKLSDAEAKTLGSLLGKLN